MIINQNLAFVLEGLIKHFPDVIYNLSQSNLNSNLAPSVRWHCMHLIFINLNLLESLFWFSAFVSSVVITKPHS